MSGKREAEGSCVPVALVQGISTWCCEWRGWEVGLKGQPLRETLVPTAQPLCVFDRGCLMGWAARPAEDRAKSCASCLVQVR